MYTDRGPTTKFKNEYNIQIDSAIKDNPSITPLKLFSVVSCFWKKLFVDNVL